MGIKAVRYAHSHHRTKLDRFLLGVSAIPTPDGGGAPSMSFTR